MVTVLEIDTRHNEGGGSLQESMREKRPKTKRKGRVATGGKRIRDSKRFLIRDSN
jgi:hypothetical protein